MKFDSMIIDVEQWNYYQSTFFAWDQGKLWLNKGKREQYFRDSFKKSHIGTTYNYA